MSNLLRGRDAIVDAEVVALDEVGHASFARLQERMHVALWNATSATGR
jgi:ATP-dependent DNA ligase